MTVNVTNSLIANITTSEDSSSNVPINRGLGNPSYDCNFGQFTTYRALAPGATTIATTPSTVAVNCAQFYFKNIDSNGPLAIQWQTTGTGGITGTPVINLYGGDMILFWCKPGSALTGIINNVQVTNLAAVNVLCEYFLGG